mmetsp:Transcript_17144/g.35881  ORF Transcript_17144/g.35881 Transcript_17144/m.35881 type:complete len:251 (+) Transcript_17144:421-1173(+)
MGLLQRRPPPGLLPPLLRRLPHRCSRRGIPAPPLRHHRPLRPRSHDPHLRQGHGRTPLQSNEPGRENNTKRQRPGSTTPLLPHVESLGRVRKGTRLPVVPLAQLPPPLLHQRRLHDPLLLRMPSLPHEETRHGRTPPPRQALRPKRPLPLRRHRLERRTLHLGLPGGLHPLLRISRRRSQIGTPRRLLQSRIGLHRNRHVLRRRWELLRHDHVRCGGGMSFEDELRGSDQSVVFVCQVWIRRRVEFGDVL